MRSPIALAREIFGRRPAAAATPSLLGLPENPYPIAQQKMKTLYEFLLHDKPSAFLSRAEADDYDDSIASDLALLRDAQDIFERIKKFDPDAPQTLVIKDAGGSTIKMADLEEMAADNYQLNYKYGMAALFKLLPDDYAADADEMIQMARRARDFQEHAPQMGLPAIVLDEDLIDPDRRKPEKAALVVRQLKQIIKPFVTPRRSFLPRRKQEKRVEN